MPLSEDRFGHADLGRFGISPKASADNKFTFNLTCRPSPYDLAPRMFVVDAGAFRSRWDKVMAYLAFWMSRHLYDPALLL